MARLVFPRRAFLAALARMAASFAPPEAGKREEAGREEMGREEVGREGALAPADG